MAWLTPLYIESHEEDGVHWIASVDGPNPEREDAVWCANREEAERCVQIFQRLIAMRAVPNPEEQTTDWRPCSR